MRPTKALISLDALTRNIRAVRERVGSHPFICFAVKADAYGHGAVPIARTAVAAGVQFLAVATVGEGQELRAAGIGVPILLFSILTFPEIPGALAADLTPFVCDRGYAAELARVAAQSGKRLPVHLKIDSGMGRVGCSPEEAAELAVFISAQPSLEYAGTATHFAVSDSTKPEDIEYTNDQLSTFSKAVESIKSAGVNPGIVHSANSGAILLYDNSYFDMVRPGIILYGYPAVISSDWPSAAAVALKKAIKPVMELVTELTFVKKVPAGKSISYGRLWTAERDTVIGGLPVGYADGLDRRLTGKISVYIRGKPFPVVGRICMDQCLVDLGWDTTFERGEPVTIMGGCAADAGVFAEITETIPHAVTCGISKRVIRVYINDDH
jgi:alanine racemase